MSEFNFECPKSGLLFYENEEASVSFSITNTETLTERFYISFTLCDYTKKELAKQHKVLKIEPLERESISFLIKLPKKGYYAADIEVVHNGNIFNKQVCVGCTSPIKKALPKDAKIGYDGVFDAERLSILSNIGYGCVTADINDVIKNKEEFKNSGITARTVFEGEDIFTKDIVAPYDSNSTYYFEKQHGDVVLMHEYSRENAHGFDLSAEGAKSSGLAYLRANNKGHYGICENKLDVHELKLLYDVGLYDYISYLNLCYQPKENVLFEFDLLEHMLELGRWMSEKEKWLPVVLRLGKTGLDGINASAYLLRCFALLLSLGVSKIFCQNEQQVRAFEPSFTDMAVCEFIRRTQDAKYAGDYSTEKGVFFKVFSLKNSFFAIAWSVGKSENHNLSIPYINEKCTIRDIMGNKLEFGQENLKISEIPVYIDDIDVGIIDNLTDLTLFPEMKENEKPMPNEVFLGINHISDTGIVDRRKSTRFLPGQCQSFDVKVRNFTNEELEDEIRISPPDCFCALDNDIKIKVAPMQSKSVPVSVACGVTAPSSMQRIWAKLKNSSASPTFYFATVVSPFTIVDPSNEYSVGDNIYLRYKNDSHEINELNISVKGIGLSFIESSFRFVLMGNSQKDIALKIIAIDDSEEKSIQVTISDGSSKATHDLKIWS